MLNTKGIIAPRSWNEVVFACRELSGSWVRPPGLPSILTRKSECMIAKMRKDYLKPLIINVALTGNVPMKDTYPGLPVTPDEIVSDVKECFELGARVFHLHMRDPEGHPTQDAGLFRETLAGVKAECPKAITCVTTSARASKNWEERIVPLKLGGDYKPDFASLSLGSFNFPDSVSLNPPREIVGLLEEMREADIRPELEIFEPGMIEVAFRLEDEGLLDDLLVFNCFFGNRGSMQFNLGMLGFVSGLFETKNEFAIAGIGKFQRQAIAVGIASETNLRIGMEDAPNLSRDRNWSNGQAVHLVAQLAELLERELETPEGARTRLGLD